MFSNYLGRNRELQGLALAMVKLWEKSAIAKIAIKHGVQNTCNERMAEELKVKYMNPYVHVCINWRMFCRRVY